MIALKTEAMHRRLRREFPIGGSGIDLAIAAAPAGLLTHRRLRRRSNAHALGSIRRALRRPTRRNAIRVALLHLSGRTRQPDARRYFDDVEAPHKEFALIADANHFAACWQPEQFLELLLTRVLPVVTGRFTPCAQAT
ncbi:hypothetical protein ACQPXH_31005 [Nocardia sp. CA-135953]|uniref:hypothetical protein n=1 Tax=Nocardia sp. CA-135953 TaxID=3239978 RepID=UPI003D95D0CA